MKNLARSIVPLLVLVAAGAGASSTRAQSGLLVSSLQTSDVRLYTPPPGSATQTIFVAPGLGGLVEPTGLTFDPQGNLYVGSSSASGAVFEYDKTGAFVKVLVPPFAGGGLLIFPEALTFGPDGNLYVANNRSVNFTNTNPACLGDVLRFDGKTGAFIDEFVKCSNNGGLSDTLDLTFGPDGNLYVSSPLVFQANGSQGGAIIRFDGNTGAFKDYFVAPGSNGLNSPWGLVFGPDYNLYVADTGTNAVFRFDGRKGTYIDMFVPANSGQLNEPTGLVFGPDMNLYVGSGLGSSSAVKRYNGQTGAYIDDYVPSSTGLQFPTFLAFSQDQSCPQSVRDSDGDGIPDCWELNGVDVNGSHISFPGANPYHKDIFVEIDWMPGWQPTQGALDDVTQAFANAPVSNLDGTTGVNLHILLDEQINATPAYSMSQAITFAPCADPMSPTPDFPNLESQWFGTATERSDPNAAALLKIKAAVYHYGIFAFGLLGSTASGCAALPGRQFTVSLGGWGFGNYTGTQEASLMHELGHNLGLWHGGFPDDPNNPFGPNSFNCKPNYLSVMSYSREYQNVWVNNRPLDFSRQTLPTLHKIVDSSITPPEPGLDDTQGIGMVPGATTYYTCPDFSTQKKNTDASGAIDWACDGSLTETGVMNDAINYLAYGPTQIPLCAGDGTDLQGFNDWANLQLNFNGPSNGAGGAPIGVGRPQPELTFEAVLSSAQDTVPPVISTSVAPAPNAAGWNNTNVGITVNCVDASGSPLVSGLQSITLTGALSATSATSPLVASLMTEGASQRIGVSCADKANNVSTSQIGPFNIDKTPPVVTVTGVTNGAVYAYGATIPTAGCNTTDALSGVATNATVTVTGGNNGAGTFTATCAGATDIAGNAAPPVSVTYSVQYNFNGYFSPILNNGAAFFHSGRTVPVKFQLTAADGSIVSNAVANIQIYMILSTPTGTVDETIDTLPSGNSNSGTLFRFDPGSGQYIYNLSTSGYASGTYLLTTTISDGTTHSVQFSIK